MARLLQINTVANQGSTGKIAEQIGLMAKKHGWESYLAYGRGSQTSQLDLIQIGSKHEVRLHALQTRLLDNHGLSSRAATLRLIQRIKTIEPDIIHLHNIHGYYLNYELLFDYLSHYTGPVVWTLHDCWAFTGHCTFFDYPNCEKWKSHCEKCPSKNAYPSSFVLDRSRKNYDDKKRAFLSLSNLILVPVSEWLQGLLMESFMKDVPSTVIHNGIDLGVFDGDRDMNDAKSQYRILSVANNWSEPRKGLRDIISLREVLPLNYSIMVVGVSEAEKRGLPNGIVGITRTSNQKELASLYANSDVFILPTYEDNFPTVILESLASGTPVITYDTGGCSEAINDSVGRTVPKGDIGLLASAIISFIESPLSREECRKWAAQQFDSEKCFKAYLDLYKTLLSK